VAVLLIAYEPHLDRSVMSNTISSLKRQHFLFSACRKISHNTSGKPSADVQTPLPKVKSKGHLSGQHQQHQHPQGEAQEEQSLKNMTLINEGY
jgi:hypothetical protein